MAPEPAHLVEDLFRREYARVVSGLVRGFGAQHLELVEDCVQDALMRALHAWPRDGVPDRPGAWITRVARNGALDRLRHRAIGERVTEGQTAEAGAAAEAPAEVALEGDVPDDELRMLFVCCDPRLAPETQLVLALKILCGFGVNEIALRLFATEAAVRKRLGRGRAQLRDDALDMECALHGLRERLPGVLRVVYLLFNEGYASSRPTAPIRRELCDEAIRLGQGLTAHPVADGASWALLALMHFHRARLDTRHGPDGGLLLLVDQDRSSWDPDHVRQGIAALMRAGDGSEPTPFHIEAAIALEHCRAPTYAETAWADIVALYEVLERLRPSPVYTLNRAVALAELSGPEAGLALLEALTPPAWLLRYYLWDAVLGDLHRRAGHRERAAHHLALARESAPTEAEQRLLDARLAALGD